MTVSDELRAWIEDRAAQRATRSSADRFATRWAAGPVHRRIGQAMGDLPPGDSSAVVAAVRRLFDEEALLEPFLDALAGQMRRDPYFEPPFRHLNSDIHTGLIVYEDDRVSIAAGVSALAALAEKKSAPRAATSIGFSGQISVMRFVRAGGSRLSFWEAPRIEAGFTAASAGRCRRTGERTIADGEILVVDGRFQSFVVEQARSDMLVLQASLKDDQAPLAVEYDSRTLELVGCSAADDSASRIQMISTLLRRLGCEAAFPAVAAFLDHPAFFVRWHVMRELLGIDAEAARPHLARMAARDPHPETRAAARVVLDRIDGAVARKAA